MRRSKKYSRPFHPVSERAMLGGVARQLGPNGAVYNVARPLLARQTEREYTIVEI